jgi:hypothetical protein
MTTATLHTVLVLTHALAATVALGAGLSVLRDGRGLRLHVQSTALMTVLVVAALVVGWSAAEPVARVTFSGLGVLAAYMTIHAWRGERIAADEQPARGVATDEPRPGPRLVEHIGFNVISLVVAGTVVPIVRLGVGPVVVALDVAVCVIVTRAFVHRRRDAVTPRPPIPA